MNYHELKESIVSFFQIPSPSDKECITPKIEEALDIVMAMFDDVVTAAGGLVKSDQNNYLFIFRKGHWDLPKGKVESNEELTDAAIREVNEETGVSGISIVRPLYTTFHTYREQTKSILKRTYWFEMKAEEQPLIPQTEEEISRAIWVEKEAVKELLKHSYDNISLLWNHFIQNEVIS